MAWCIFLLQQWGEAPKAKAKIVNIKKTKKNELRLYPPEIRAEFCICNEKQKYVYVFMFRFMFLFMLFLFIFLF